MFEGRVGFLSFDKIRRIGFDEFLEKEDRCF